MFHALLAVNALTWCVIMYGFAVELRRREPAPQRVLAHRAWRASQFVVAEARALGPLHRRLLRAALHYQQRAAAIAGALDAPRRPAVGALRLAELAARPALASLGLSWRQRREELFELAHMVEQLEALGAATARYRAGIGRLWELDIPLRSLDCGALEACQSKR
ncbi:MAG: hypothetical protein OEZ06_13340 [Myxococcales bacterium]|nr:hypothetical protein [Myxococcales bacterium]